MHPLFQRITFTVVVSSLLLSCVPQRQLEEEQSKRRNCETELETAKSSRQSMETDLNETKSKLTDADKRLTGLRNG
jgi:chromosome segregation ATPase